MTKSRVLLSWSSGKDSAWCLHLLRQNPDIEVAALLTTFNAAADRVAMHAVRRELVAAQAARAELPLWSVELPWPCANEIYEQLMAEACRRALDEGISSIAFGDLFLRDIRAYRERQLAAFGLQPIFPLWDMPTDILGREMIGAGVKARITCVDLAKLDLSFAGRDFDEDLLRDLPPGTDPCGENGEFHTFVCDSPAFRTPIPIERGEIIEREGFAFADIIPHDIVPRRPAGDEI